VSEGEKHVGISERCFNTVHITQREAVVRERLLIGAICLIQAVAVISCDRDFTKPVHICGVMYDSTLVHFEGYGILLTHPARFRWTTSTALSTSYKWRTHDPIGAWVDHPDTPPTLALSHYAILSGVTGDHVKWEFMPYGKDSDGVIHEGRTVIVETWSDDMLEKWRYEEME
jgi:hypothetical protein